MRTAIIHSMSGFDFEERYLVPLYEQAAHLDFLFTSPQKVLHAD